MSLMTTGPVHVWIGWTSTPTNYERSSAGITSTYAPTNSFPAQPAFTNTYSPVVQALPPALASLFDNPYVASFTNIIGGLANAFSATPQSDSADQSQAAADNGDSTPPPLISANVPVQNTYYLGTGEDPPEIRIRPAFRTIKNVDFGHDATYDKAYMGRDAIITMTLSEWDEATYRIVAARMNTRALNPSNRGTDNADAIGSLLVSEGLALTLYLQFPTTQARTKINGMPDGYRFLCAYPMEELVMPGTRYNTLKLTWHAWKLYNSQAKQDQILFDHDMGVLPTLPDVYGYTTP